MELNEGDRVTGHVGKGMRLTKRDIEVLKDIAKCRMLTAEQVQSLHFEGVRWRHYDRLNRMAKEGYILKEQDFPKGGRKAACCFITEQGARVAGVSLQRARLNYVPPRLRVFWRNLMEIYVNLKPYGWDWIDSRDAKREYGINRGDTVDGLLKAPDGEEYGVYLLGENPQPTTIEDIQAEIRRIVSTPLRSFVIFAPNPASLAMFGKDNLGTYRLKLLDYPDGIAALRYTADPTELLWMMGLDYPYTKIYETFASILVQMGNREHYVTELLTNDLARIYQLERYTRERAEENGRRGVIIAVRRKDLEKYAAQFAAYPHFRLVPVQI